MGRWVYTHIPPDAHRRPATASKSCPKKRAHIGQTIFNLNPSGGCPARPRRTCRSRYFTSIVFVPQRLSRRASNPTCPSTSTSQLEKKQYAENIKDPQPQLCQNPTRKTLFPTGPGSTHAGSARVRKTKPHFQLRSPFFSCRHEKSGETQITQHRAVVASRAKEPSTNIDPPLRSQRLPGLRSSSIRAPAGYVVFFQSERHDRTKEGGL